MTELVPYTSDPPAFNAEWLLDPAEIAQRIGGTDFVPRGLRDNPAAITAALLYGQEVGLGRMASLATIAVIDGRPALSSEAQRALVLAAGHELWFEETTETRCIACGRRRGSKQVTRITWTIDDAKRAGLAGRNAWRTYPRQMLTARASAELARAVFPDVVRGLHALEELDGDEGGGAAASLTPPDPDPKPTRRRRRPKSGGTGNGEAQTRAAVEPGASVSEPPHSAEAGDLENAPPAADDQPPDTSDVEAIDQPPPDPPPDVELAPPEDPVGAAAPAPAPTPDEEGPLPASDAQLRHVFALMRDVGLDAGDRELRLSYTSRVIQRPIESSANLTQAEAHALIEDLQAIAALPAGLERDKRLLPPNEAQLLLDAEEELGARLVE